MIQPLISRAVIAVWLTAGSVSAARAQHTLVSVDAAAAREPALRRKISIDTQLETLGTALARVARAAELDFVLDGTVTELQTPISARIQQLAVVDAVAALIQEACAEHRVEVIVAQPATLIVRSTQSSSLTESRSRQTDSGAI